MIKQHYIEQPAVEFNLVYYYYCIKKQLLVMLISIHINLILCLHHHHIEYPPYINSIYSRCYPTGDLIVTAPTIGWHEAQRIRNKYYFDEVFYYLHMHVAKICTQASSNTASSITQLATDSDATSKLMTVLVDRLKLFLKPAAL